MTQENEKPPAEGHAPQAAREEPAADPGIAEPKSPPPGATRYVFKIVPADPKNAFNFEDVADK